jgi:hypothetical protein
MAQDDAVLPDLRRKVVATETDLATRKERLPRAESERLACTNDLNAAVAAKPIQPQAVSDLTVRCSDLTREVRFLKRYIARIEAAAEPLRDELARAERERAQHEKEAADARSKRLECERNGCKPKRTPWLGPRVEIVAGPSMGVVKPDIQLALGAAGSVGFLDHGHGRIAAAVQMHMRRDRTTILVPLGYEHVVPIGSSGVYLVPRVSGGYAFESFTRSPTSSHYGVILPELGVRIPIVDKVVIGLDPVSFPVLVDKSGASVSWRPMLAAGLTL